MHGHNLNINTLAFKQNLTNRVIEAAQPTNLLLSLGDNLVVQQHLHSLHILLVDGVQQGVADLHAVREQQLDHLDVFVLYRHQQRRATQGVQAIQVHARRLGLGQVLPGGRDIAALHLEIAVQKINKVYRCIFKWFTRKLI